ncbi:MAG: endolytic transglycosylase MltG [Candidatus Daviesbacteria bacterium]|nr:endolytic transglycosylase MltG [Candidatus Daviesbacteria bacterium]
MRKKTNNITFIIIITFIIVIVICGWWNSQLVPVSSDKSTKVFVIAKGVGVSDIAKKLKEENLIKSELVFKIYIKQNNFTNKLQAGSYKLSPSMSVQELVKNLQIGSEDVWVTLIEGWRLEEMADKLNEQLKIDKKQFLKSAKEGYMFPDTYLFPKEATVEYVTDTLRKTFDTRLNSELRSKIRSQGLTEEQGVILASIVEREARSDKARMEVASILLKRFKIGMGLNADATVQYALVPKGSENAPADGWWKRNLTKDDLKIDSPYNTYLHSGLPPTPICNPGLASLQAVANVDPSTPYLYYYHDSKGVSHYAKTLEEHNQNVVNYP